MTTKRTARRVALVALGVVAVAAAGLWSLRGPIATRAMSRIIVRNMTNGPLSDLPDGLHVGLCGTGSPLPDPHRSGPCTVVMAGKRVFIVDAGEGAAKSLTLMGLMPARAERVLLTHFHSDHIDGLGAVLLQHWGGGASKTPMPVVGPQGVEQVVAGYNAAYRLDSGYRIAHHGEQVMPPSGFGGVAQPFQVSAQSPDIVLIDEPDLKVIAFPVNHSPVEPAVGYKFVYKGRSAVISGDTAPSPRVEAEAKGVDLLVHEALAPGLVAMQEQAARTAGRTNLQGVFHDIPDYHTTPEQAAGIAQRAGVGYLVFTHIVPGLPLRALNGPFLGRSKEIFKGPLRLGEDGDMLSLPAGSKEIKLSHRMQG
jgi:ribonuclease Z